MINNKKYLSIINILCEINNIPKEELINILREKEMKYMLVLFLKKYNCCDYEELKELLNVKTKRSVNNNYRKAEEKLLMNKKFREKYFELEEYIDKSIEM